MRTVLLLIESSRGSGRSLLHGVVNYSRIHGPWSFQWKPTGLDEDFSAMRDMPFDGIIMRDSKEIENFLQLNIPMIVIRHYHEETPGQINIITDYHAVGQMAAQHLLDRNLKHFGYCGISDTSWSINRYGIFAEHIRNAGYRVSLFGHEKYSSLEEEQKAMIRWLEAIPKPAGIMCCNDDRSHYAAQLCKSRNIPVPDDVALIGVDNDEMVCELSDPPLSSVSLNFERAGFEGAALLDQMMANKTIEKQNIIVKATHVVTRQSTEITAIDDRFVTTAIRYIHDNAKYPIQVRDVAETVPLTRRALEKRFRKVLNRSILDEIRRERTKLIAQMLVETNYSILKIALNLGFQGTEHISRYFKKEKGMSLLQFRKKFGNK